jgi:hypothetical protein
VAVLLGVEVAEPASRPVSGASCRNEGISRSVSSKDAVRLTIVNRRATVQQLFWLDYEGKRKLYHSLLPGQSVVQDTFATHPWLIADAQGSCQGIFLPEGATAGRLEITDTLP